MEIYIAIFGLIFSIYLIVLFIGMANDIRLIRKRFLETSNKEDYSK